MGGEKQLNKYAGKTRIGLITMLGVAALAIAGLHRSSARAYGGSLTPTILVTDVCSDAVTAYSAASNGDVSPLAPAPTGLSSPQFVAVDASGNIYATNYCTASVTIYAKGSTGDAAPTAVIGGSKTGLTSPYGIALDSSGKIYVVERQKKGACLSGAGKQHRGAQRGAHRHYHRDQHQVERAIRHRAGFQRQNLCGGLRHFKGAGLSGAGSSTGTLNEAPTATITGVDTGLINPYGIALDSSANIYVADDGATSVFVYSAGSTGDAAPIAIISGGDTGLSDPYGIALDSAGNIYVADNSAASVFVYPPLGGSGWVAGPPATYSVAPIASIAGSNTRLSGPIRHRAGFQRQHLRGG